MVNPIKPSEVSALKAKEIPDGVMEAWNEAISEKWDGERSNIKQKYIVGKIAEKMDIEDVYEHQDWLNIEGIFKQSGWNVVYDKPAYYETYDANFIFTVKKD